MMIKNYSAILSLLAIFCLNIAGNAWAQSCPINETPICKKIDGNEGTLNADKTKCIYKAICSSTKEPPVKGACADNLVCPTGTTGTPPDKCETTERQCANGSALVNGKCPAAPPVDGKYECPPPSVWDATEGKCLFELDTIGIETTIDSFCPDGYYKDGDHCAQQRACANGIWSDPCINHPNSDEICAQADKDTPF